MWYARTFVFVLPLALSAMNAHAVDATPQECKTDPLLVRDPIVSFSFNGKGCILEIPQQNIVDGNVAVAFTDGSGNYYLLGIRDFLDMPKGQEAELIFPDSERVEKGDAYVCPSRIGRYIRWDMRELGSAEAYRGCTSIDSTVEAQ